MACMKLGSKADLFSRDGNSLFCTAGLPSDVIVRVGDMSFHVHKFPLLSRSQVLEKMIKEDRDGTSNVLQLYDIPGGPKTFELILNFCYDMKLELTALNVVCLRCAAEHLQMTEEYGKRNLISVTEGFLDEVLVSWKDTIKAIKTCEDLLPHAEGVNIVSRCIKSLAARACLDSSSFNWPPSRSNSMRGPDGSILWNGISTGEKPEIIQEDWWYKDASSLSLNLYKRLILEMTSRRMRPEMIAGSLMFYTNSCLPHLIRHSTFQNTKSAGLHFESFPVLSETDQRVVIEVIVVLLPMKMGAISTKFLLGLLRTAIILHADPLCREKLERRIGEELDEVALEDILIPNLGHAAETLYDIDCFQRTLNHFMLANDSAPGSSPSIIDDGPLMESSSLTPMTRVSQLVDSYLAEVASDGNLKHQKFLDVAELVPDYARLLDDGLYRAIDIYLKAHPWLTDSEKEQLCHLMNCERLSLEACAHAAQNERLPLRVVVEVLFYEHLRLRTSIASWLMASDNLENSQAREGKTGLLMNGESTLSEQLMKEDLSGNMDEMKTRVSVLEEECQSMRKEINKLEKPKRSSWNIFSRKCGAKQKSRSCVKLMNGDQNHKKQ